MTKSSITKLLGIKYPIIQGGMAGVSESILVSAVSNAGGLGVIGSGFFPPSWLEREIKKTKELTDKPFGVNLLIQNPNVPELLKIIIKENRTGEVIKFIADISKAKQKLGYKPETDIIEGLKSSIQWYAP